MPRVRKGEYRDLRLSVEAHEDNGKRLTIPLWRERVEEDTGRGIDYARPMRKQNLTLKVFFKLISLHERYTEQHELLVQQQMIDEDGYDHKLWAKIDALELTIAKIGGAIAGLRWVLDLTDALGLDMQGQYMGLDLSKLRESEEDTE